MPSQAELRTHAEMVLKFCQDLKMNFRFDKFAVAYFSEGKLELSSNIKMEVHQEIK